MTDYFPTVVQVIPKENYTVLVFFDDGKITLYDAAGLIKKGIFTKLQDISIFMDTCTVMNGTLAWDIDGKRNASECLDIDPFMLYEQPAINGNIAWNYNIFYKIKRKGTRSVEYIIIEIPKYYISFLVLSCFMY